jgi:hypothetical protein
MLDLGERWGTISGRVGSAREIEIEIEGFWE